MTIAGPGPVSASPEDHEGFEATFESALGKIVATVLSSLGPMTVVRLGEVLARSGALQPLIARGYDEGEQLGFVECLLASDEDRFFETADDRFAHIATLLDGIVLTHRVTESEVRRNMLDVTPDLCLLTRWRRLRFGLAGGGTVALRYPWSGEALSEAADALGLPRNPEADDDGSLVSPAGWLEGVSGGDLVGVGHVGGVLSLDRLVAPVGAAEAAEARAALAGAFDRQTGGADLGARTVDLLLDALAHEPTLLRSPIPPVTDLLAELGLERDGESICRFPIEA